MESDHCLPGQKNSTSGTDKFWNIVMGSNRNVDSIVDLRRAEDSANQIGLMPVHQAGEEGRLESLPVEDTISPVLVETANNLPNLQTSSVDDGAPTGGRYVYAHAAVPATLRSQYNGIEHTTSGPLPSAQELFQSIHLYEQQKQTMPLKKRTPVDKALHEMHVAMAISKASASRSMDESATRNGGVAGGQMEALKDSENVAQLSEHTTSPDTVLQHAQKSVLLKLPVGNKRALHVAGRESIGTKAQKKHRDDVPRSGEGDLTHQCNRCQEKFDNEFDLNSHMHVAHGSM